MNEVLRILLVEDNPGDADFILELLPATGQPGFHIETVVRLSEALERANNQPFDVVLLDLGLPDAQGLPTYHRMRHVQPDLPVIVLTGTDDQELAVIAVRDGAQDFLVKGLFNQGLLTRAIRYAIERQKSQAILHQSATDLRILTTRLHNVREQERATLSRDLHDNLGQHLTFLQISLMWMDQHLQAANPPDLAELYDRIVAMVPIVERLTEQTQTICTSLRSAILDDLGLVAAIEWQVEDTAKRCGLQFTLSMPDEIDLKQELALSLFRIVQEALTNVIRHAQATHVHITLHTCDRELELTIQDNGRGCANVLYPRTITLGLLGMRERADTFGGTVEFLSEPNHGATVRVRIPRDTPIIATHPPP